MEKYIIRRLLIMIPTMLIVGIFAFLIVQLTPGDPTAAFLGPDAPPEQAEELRVQLGLDQPIHVQFYNWFSQVLRGNLGTSFHRRQPVTSMFLRALPPTLLLASLSCFIAIFIALPAGLIASVKKNSLADKLFSIFVLVGLGTPNFWLGMILVIVFSVGLNWLPVQGFVLPQENLLLSLKHLLLPSISLGYPAAAFIARMTRSSMLEVLKEQYITTARGKGLKERKVIIKHAFRNSLSEILTVIGIVIVSLLSGSVAVELLFNYPGVGRLVVNAVFRRDYPVIQGSLILIAFFILLVNLIIDLLYGYIDPRIRYE